ncbi:ABC-type nitrate/sulfonate/bicarbonate transport system, permease component [Desulfosporosinus acidiphilus SJ4]|uniref:ABC-type nitrate/sulfonate/bicarbonate transport system, permease component n=1 Tax=Desulfosporosinus acidiphilus (strain DSM 22704 / JCM 16185 / SJ4) TaxID=646529 RepID=I4D1Z6_DESAJ|nr:ABC transporter permease [Desulfosporosinus acidiphilus]AFM39820.1 ABC-type nitrate/sulfonate/bicarbonate transport system, permease component [Desulfosporosinus acidiphilus SJ4]
MTRFLKRTYRGLLLPLVLILVWEILNYLGLVNAYLLPPPSGIIDRLFSLAHNGELLKNLSASLYRVGCGFGLAICLALPLGFLLGLARKAQGYLSPFLTFLQQIPAIAWIPMFILWLGIDEASKITIITYSGFFPIFLNTMHGISNTDPKLKEAASTFGLSPGQIIIRVYLPSAAPSIFIGMRLGLSFCWRSLVAAELLGASKGIGYLIQEGRELAQPDLMIAGVLVIGLTGLVLDFFFRRLEKMILPWRETFEADEVPKWQPF